MASLVSPETDHNVIHQGKKAWEIKQGKVPKTQEMDPGSNWCRVIQSSMFCRNYWILKSEFVIVGECDVI
jgi:hypothetical protein